MASSNIATVVVVSFSIIVILSSPDFVSTRLTIKQIDLFGKACRASEDDLATVKSYQVPATESGKCLMKCMITKLRLLDVDGSYNKKRVETALKKFWSEWPVDKVLLINNKCSDESKRVPAEKATSCEHAYEVMTCINNQARKLGLL